jgi:hypothetical protein
LLKNSRNATFLDPGRARRPNAPGDRMSIIRTLGSLSTIRNANSRATRFSMPTMAAWILGSVVTRRPLPSLVIGPDPVDAAAF